MTRKSKIGKIADEVEAELRTRFNDAAGTVISGSGFNENPPWVNIYLARDLGPQEKEQLIHKHKNVEVKYHNLGPIVAQAG